MNYTTIFFLHAIYALHALFIHFFDAISTIYQISIFNFAANFMAWLHSNKKHEVLSWIMKNSTLEFGMEIHEKNTMDD